MKKFTIILSFLSIFSCTSKDIIIEEISFLHDNSNAQPSLVSKNGSLSLTWISSNEDKKAALNFSQFKDGEWTNPQTVATGSDWFVNWADFPTHAISGDLILTSYLKKSASGTYTYDVFLNLQKLSGEKIKEDFVLDGEILAVKDQSVLLFNDLQKRLNRKTISKKLLQDVPIGFFAYDILEINDEDLRAKSLQFRRNTLEKLFSDNQLSKPNFKLSEVIQFDKWEELNVIRNEARLHNSEGLMLKQKQSKYHVGRKKGDWWKWKVDPLTIDAVMIYAQKGSGRRSSKYTDYTFAVKTEDGLVTVAKAYSGLTNDEITEISRWVNKNAIEKFGPVRTVKPKLVFEIAFEGIAFSKRHKSGVALRFPRIKRWRKDKPVSEIDTIETVKQLITNPLDV